MTHGGSRPGAGRKPGYRKPDAKRRAVCLRLTEEEYALAVRLGSGNASAGLRTALLMTALLQAPQT